MSMSQFYDVEIFEDRNVFGEKLETCSMNPTTGFFRNGCCSTGPEDFGVHTVCVVCTQEFLEFSRSAGNDLITPMPFYNFPGLKPGDSWCLCASRWKEAYEAGCAPLVILEATHEKTLDIIPLDILVQFAYRSAG
jgi:uncharacterized protein (DUF2237 family)